MKGFLWTQTHIENMVLKNWYIFGATGTSMRRHRLQPILCARRGLLVILCFT